VIWKQQGRRKASLSAAIAVLSLGACAQSEEAFGAARMNADDPWTAHVPSRDAATPDAIAPPDASDTAPSEDCSTVRGALYSPGGSTLPKPCQPFHPTLNNPYAVRCVDALPDFESGFPGDDACILPPPPAKGMQIGLHPQGDSNAYWAAIRAGDMSGYADAGSEYVQPVGSESTRNFQTYASEAGEHAYYRIYYRLRAGGHHTIVTLHENAGEPAGWIGGQDSEVLPGFVTDLFTLLANIGGQQRMDENVPVTLDKPDEDRGLYLQWPADPSVLINYHGFNPTEGALLRETWINVWWEEERDVLARWFLGYELLQIVTLEIAPGSVADLHYAIELRAPSRLLSLLAHRHAWTSNMSAWVERKDGSTELLYRSFDWSDVPTYRYDSLAQNPSPASDARNDGAASGVMTFEPGDVLHYNCHVEYTDERALEVDAPRLPAEQGPLFFANQVYEGEMCVLFGTVTGDPFDGLPLVNLTPLPAFATVK
jgi:hypothetical protein